MIVRRVLPTSPVGVEYSLTPLGRSLLEPSGQLCAWTVVHADVVRARQVECDQRAHRGEGQGVAAPGKFGELGGLIACHLPPRGASA
ncbi:winged helix-turn-helix transcriptional regulator [Kitasatospora sp. NPDC057936]